MDHVTDRRPPCHGSRRPQRVRRHQADGCLHSASIHTRRHGHGHPGPRGCFGCHRAVGRQAGFPGRLPGVGVGGGPLGCPVPVDACRRGPAAPEPVSGLIGLAGRPDHRLAARGAVDVDTRRGGRVGARMATRGRHPAAGARQAALLPGPGAVPVLRRPTTLSSADSGGMGGCRGDAGRTGRHPRQRLGQLPGRDHDTHGEHRVPARYAAGSPAGGPTGLPLGGAVHLGLRVPLLCPELVPATRILGSRLPGGGLLGMPGGARDGGPTPGWGRLPSMPRPPALGGGRGSRLHAGRSLRLEPRLLHRPG